MRILLFTILLFCSSLVSGQQDHQIKIDPAMSKDTIWVMLSDSASASPYYGRGMWYSLATLISQIQAGFSGGGSSTFTISDGSNSENLINQTLTVTGVGGIVSNYSTGSNILEIDGSTVGNQLLSNTSDATSHTVTLTDGNGDPAASFKIAEGSGITIATTGTSTDGVATISATGLSDGDKGDITVSSSGATWTVDNGLAATKIADGSVSSTEFQYINSVTSNVQTQLNSKLSSEVDGSTTNEIQGIDNVLSQGETLTAYREITTGANTLTISDGVSPSGLVVGGATGGATFGDLDISGGTSLRYDGASKMFIDDGGQTAVFGINVVSPTEALDVVGNGLFSGTLTASNLSGTNTGDQDLSAYALNSDVVHDTGDETVAGMKNFTSNIQVPNDAYNATTWNTNTDVPNKDALRDKIETLVNVSDTSTMLAHFIERSDTSAMLSHYIERQDTASMLSHFVERSDTSSMLSHYIDRASAETIYGVKTFNTDPIVPAEAYASGWNGSNEPPTKNDVYDKLELFATGTGVDHGGLTGLGDDDHTQYAKLAGRSGGQTLIGGTATTDDLILQSTSGVGATGSLIQMKVGNNGGTTAMTIQNDAKVGVGTTSPDYLFEVESSNPALSINDTDGTNRGFLNAYFQSSGIDYYGLAINRDGASGVFANTGRAAAIVQLESNVNNADIVFYTHTSNNTVPLDRMRILGSGLVGIGTVGITQAGKLHVVSTTEQLRLGYDATNYLSTTISSTGSPTFNATGTTPSFTFSDPVLFDGYARLKAYTVATLPTGVTGAMAYVTDATAPTYLGVLTGGGAVTCPVFYNGSAWVSH